MTLRMDKLVAYIRVSTTGQGRSGLGLEAQRDALASFASINGMDIVATFEEVESGKGSDALATRPQLRKALEAARKAKAAVAVAKLDRLSRDVHFISGLMSHKVPFLVAELGADADPFMLHIYAALAEKERKMISARTEASLAVVRAKIEAGVAMGRPHVSRSGRQVFKLGNPTTLDTARARGNSSLKANSDRFAANVLPIIRQIQATGTTTGRAIADVLNARGIPTARGGRWHDTSVRNVLRRSV
jgi:DNA invertase Pin-like site-specific DNA recombinase